MNDQAFRELLNLLMVSDPEPIPMEALKDQADKFARERGFDDGWIVAYHEFKPNVERPEPTSVEAFAKAVTDLCNTTAREDDSNYTRSGHAHALLEAATCALEGVDTPAHKLLDAALVVLTDRWEWQRGLWDKAKGVSG